MARKSMMVDTSICIGCKGCEVACKQWNELPAEILGFSGQSYDNTLRLSAHTWCHVGFTEQQQSDEGFRWLFLSDRCKHCEQAGCLEACPTGAIYHTESGAVNIDQDVCNGCRNCVAACPFGVISYNRATGVVDKCTLCTDRQALGREPACVTACPTDALVFGDRAEMLALAREKQSRLAQRGVNARIYGEHELGGLNVFFLLQDEPEAYGLPSNPQLPQKNVWPASGLSIGSALLVGLAAVVSFRNQRLGALDEEEVEHATPTT